MTHMETSATFWKTSQSVPVALRKAAFGDQLGLTVEASTMDDPADIGRPRFGGGNIG